MFEPPAPGGFVPSTGAVNSKMAQQMGGADLPDNGGAGPLVAATAQRMMSQGASKAEIQSAIRRAAEEAGVNPAFALAVAQRESSFNPRARNSKTIRGLFQMRGDLRRQFGIGDTDDPYDQAAGWSRFIPQVRKEMSGVLGRDVGDEESYLGHHFGGRRAARMLKMDPSTPVEAVFTPREMRENPHFARAGTVGSLNGSVMGDIGKRMARFGGGAAPALSTEPADLSSFGELVGASDEAGDGTPTASVQPSSLSQASSAATNPAGRAGSAGGSTPAIGELPDLSSFGELVS